jgi:hypothetical protein
VQAIDRAVQGWEIDLRHLNISLALILRVVLLLVTRPVRLRLALPELLVPLRHRVAEGSGAGGSQFCWLPWRPEPRSQEPPYPLRSDLRAKNVLYIPCTGLLCPTRRASSPASGQGLHARRRPTTDFSGQRVALRQQSESLQPREDSRHTQAPPSGRHCRGLARRASTASPAQLATFKAPFTPPPRPPHPGNVEGSVWISPFHPWCCRRR